jgi:hypothetical protein
MDGEPKNYNQTFNFLSEVYEVVKSFDKANKNPAHLNSKVNELKSKFDKAKQVLNNMNGIQMSYIEQQEYYKSLLKQYELKLELLDNYKAACSSFDTSEIQVDNNGIKNDSIMSQQKINATVIKDEQIDVKSDDIEMDFGNI